MKRNLTCIVCPIGCSIEVEINNGEVLSVTGNSCMRGEEYAKKECVSPERTVTTTMLCTNGEMLPVKTSVTIPKDKIFECMEIINKAVAETPVKMGDVIIKDVFGADIVATADR